MKPEEHLIPPKSHVYLDGPKSRGFNYHLLSEFFGNLFVAFGSCILLAHVLLCLGQQDLRKIINFILLQENSGKEFLIWDSLR